MGTAYIPTTVTAVEAGILLFESDCTAEVEYEVDGSDLADFTIRDFKFEAFLHEWDAAACEFKRIKSGVVWCPDDLRPVLLKYADRNAIEEALVEKLIESGELTYANNEQRSDYHARAL